MRVVNLFAGPGAGKSTMAAGVFAGLKLRGVLAELALEFAKELTWEGRTSALNCQPFVFGEQLFRLQRLQDAGVEVVVTDSPLLLSAVYGDVPDSFKDAIRKIDRKTFTSLNFFVTRVKTFEPRGRNQSAAEALALDYRIRDEMNRHLVQFKVVPGDDVGVGQVVGEVLEALA